MVITAPAYFLTPTTDSPSTVTILTTRIFFSSKFLEVINNFKCIFPDQTIFKVRKQFNDTSNITIWYKSWGKGEVRVIIKSIHKHLYIGNISSILLTVWPCPTQQLNIQFCGIDQCSLAIKTVNSLVSSSRKGGVNTLCVKLFWGKIKKKRFPFSWHSDNAGGWNFTCWKPRTHLFYIVNTMTTDGLVMQGKRCLQPWN